MLESVVCVKTLFVLCFIATTQDSKSICNVFLYFANFFTSTNYEVYLLFLSDFALIRAFVRTACRTELAHKS